MLHTQFVLKDLGILSYFLGIEVSYPPREGLFLSQTKYITDLLHKVDMFEAKSISTPMVSGSVLSAFGGENFSDAQLYRQIVETLQYATITRPETTYSVNKICQFMHNPSLVHWQTVIRILRYLKGTFSLGLHLKCPANLRLSAYADAD